MSKRQHWILVCLVLGLLLVLPGNVGICQQAEADHAGLTDLDDAMRSKVNAQGLQDLNRVIELLQSALDKGLDAEDAAFAEQMMSDSLMERASTLVRVINTRSILDQRVQQIQRLVISDLRRVLAYNDPPSEASFLLGKLMALPGGDPHEARRVLTTFLDTEDLPREQRAEALVLRARVQTDNKKALGDFEKAIELEPENANYRLLRAVFLRSQKKLEDALAEVERVIAQSPEDTNALILQGEVLRDLGQVDSALKSFDQATKLSPKTPSPYQSRGEIFRDKGEYEKAAEEFSKVLELQPGQVLTLIHRAEAYLRSNRLDEALADIEVVLERQPLVAAHRIRAEILANMDRIKEAIVEMQRISTARPDQIDLKMQLALYFQVDKQPQKAIEVYSEVLSRESNSIEAFRGRGDAYLSIGKHAAAIGDFEQALKLQPDDPALLNNLAWVLATSPEEKVRNGKRAVTLATKACELTDYDKPHILSTLAAAFAESGDFQTAIEWSQKAVDLKDPEQGEQLAKELDSYRDGQPWRERQSVAEQEAPPTESPANSSESPDAPLDF